MDTTSLINKSIHEILTPVREPVHSAWIDVRTTSIATSMAILRLADENLLMLAPCEVQLEAAPINAVLSKVTPEKFVSHLSVL